MKLLSQTHGLLYLVNLCNHKPKKIKPVHATTCRIVWFRVFFSAFAILIGVNVQHLYMITGQCEKKANKRITRMNKTHIFEKCILKYLNHPNKNELEQQRTTKQKFVRDNKWSARLYIFYTWLSASCSFNVTILLCYMLHFFNLDGIAVPLHILYLIQPLHYQMPFSMPC